MTLAFVLMVTSLKEGSEDLQRSRSDKFENLRDVTVVTFGADGSEITEVRKSKDVNPGDIIKLTGQTAAPVDMLLIFTSLHNDGNKCFVETANIDGETNLKVREAPPGLLESFGDDIIAGRVRPEMFKGSIECECPNKNIHTFVGTLKLNDAREYIPLSANNLVLRSSLFSNTDWGYGIAVYTGKETKIQMNNRHAPSKMSQLEGNLNTAIIIIFCAQVVLVTISVISIYIMGFDDESKLPYVYPPNSDDSSILPLWLEQWFVFFLLYNNFIPISLYVTIELVNLGQAFLVANDEQLYREELDVACQVRASNLLQELGMVSNVFSDKTGTLTRNEMKLVKFVLNGTVYDVPHDAVKEGNEGSPVNSSAVLSQFGSNKQAFLEFCRCLITCHTVVREKTGKYRAESPDELALVEGVGPYHCFLKERGSKEMVVDVLGEKRTYEVLAVNPFNADRKRMSVLIRDSSNKYYVMCKGADNIMMPLCNLSEQEMGSINESLLAMANLGLRTLIIASKALTAEAANAWLAQYKAAMVSTVNREEKIAEAGALLEQRMECLGITAIEDRLQDEVPEVIADLNRAGIILWMLTGDKLETAINIGHSCNLLLHDTKLLMLSKIPDEETFARRLQEEYNWVVHNKNSRKPNTNLGLVLDGPSFHFFNDRNPEQRKMLLTLGQSCRSVIACRLTPTQKRELVRLVKKDCKPKATTLSIGDGANDVSMILEADVGVGIYGKEGRQAANNADFAIGEFKFLRRLVLVHGRWNYIRQSSVFLYSMHKNMVLTLTLFWFSYYTAVSGTSLYQSWVYTGFNFILGLPIIFYGILDRDLDDEFVLRYPAVYSTSRTDKLLQVSAISKWIVNAVFYAIVVCLISYSVLAPTFTDMSLFVAGTVVFSGLCMALQAKVAFFYHQWAYPQVLAMFISVLGMILYFILIAAATWDYWYVAQETYIEPIYWYYGMFSIPIIVIFIDWLDYFIQMMFFPTDEMLFKEIQLNVSLISLKFMDDIVSLYSTTKSLNA
ncbi:phospholipid-transporting ATPase [archaeon]|nr:MAG: phospholipid-transporting ATPase [archaeon]